MVHSDNIYNAGSSSSANKCGWSSRNTSSSPINSYRWERVAPHWDATIRLCACALLLRARLARRRATKAGAVSRVSSGVTRMPDRVRRARERVVTTILLRLGCLSCTLYARVLCLGHHAYIQKMQVDNIPSYQHIIITYTELRKINPVGLIAIYSYLIRIT